MENSTRIILASRYFKDCLNLFCVVSVDTAQRNLNCKDFELRLDFTKLVKQFSGSANMTALCIFQRLNRVNQLENKLLCDCISSVTWCVVYKGMVMCNNSIQATCMGTGWIPAPVLIRFSLMMLRQKMRMSHGKVLNEYAYTTE